MTEICESTGKTGYGRREVGNVIRKMRYSKSIKKKPQRSYFCTECKLWHITSVVDNKYFSRKQK